MGGLWSLGYYFAAALIIMSVLTLSLIPVYVFVRVVGRAVIRTIKEHERNHHG